MKRFALVLGLAIAWLTLGAASAGVVATTTLSGTDNIFAAGLSSILNDPSVNGGEGTLPFDLAVTGGEQLFATTSGAVWCCDGNGGVSPSTAHGYDTNPFNGYPNFSVITNTVIGSTVPEYETTSGGIFELLYIFTDSTGAPIGKLAALSNNGTSGFLTAPSNATNLYFGFADGFGFEGPSGAYGDNVNDPAAGAPGILLTISSVPEPAAWALMFLGVFLIGAALRGRQSRQLA
jgi:hypothetical protein